MVFFDFNLLKKFTLKLKSFFKYEKHEKNINQSVINQSIVNQSILISCDSLGRELIERLPESRQANVKKIVSQAEESTQKENVKINPPEPEWFGPFLDSCKDVRSEDIQKLWSKILQGKINGKRNTSIRTMSLLSKMNSSEVHFFNQFLKYMIRDSMGHTPLNNFIYYEKYKNEIFFSIDQISLFLEIGLITQTVNEQIIRPTIFINNHETRVGVLGLYYDYILFVYFNPIQTHLLIPAIFLSKTGLELSKFVNYKGVDMEVRSKGYLSYFSKFLKTQGFQLKALSRKKCNTLRNFIGQEVEDIY